MDLVEREGRVETDKGIFECVLGREFVVFRPDGRQVWLQPQTKNNLASAILQRRGFATNGTGLTSFRSARRVGRVAAKDDLVKPRSSVYQIASRERRVRGLSENRRARLESVEQCLGRSSVGAVENKGPDDQMQESFWVSE